MVRKLGEIIAGTEYEACPHLSARDLLGVIRNGSGRLLYARSRARKRLVGIW